MLEMLKSNLLDGESHFGETSRPMRSAQYKQ